MTSEYDEDDQPKSVAFSWHRLGDSRMDELIGVCRGILADGVLLEEEAQFLFKWLGRNKPVRHTPLGRQLYERLKAALSNNVSFESQEDELVALILDFIGGSPATMQAASYSSRLPLDDPPPAVEFEEMAFCFTGKFTFGPRKECEAIVEQLGGQFHANPIKATDYLVIGDIGSRDWAHSTHGRKIEKALDLREGGFHIHIIHEEHWSNAIPKKS